MEFTPSTKSINELKKVLADTIIKNNYDLTCEEVLHLSITLDKLMVPIFQSQLDLFSELSTKMNYYSFK